MARRCGACRIAFGKRRQLGGLGSPDACLQLIPTLLSFGNASSKLAGAAWPCSEQILVTKASSDN